MFRAFVYRALLASPSGLATERAAVEKALNLWNATHAAEMNIVVLPSKWETDVSPDFGQAPQAIINQSIVDPCDLLIGIFGETLGTPTQNAASGAVEEIQRVHRAGKPVLLYFGDRVTNSSSIDPVQLTALRDFKEYCRNVALYGVFADANELAQKVERDLLRVMRRIRFPTHDEPQRPASDYLVSDGVLTLRSHLNYYDYFATEADGETVILEDARVLLSFKKISSMMSLLPALEVVARHQERLLLIAPGIEGEALDTLAANKMRGTIACCPVDFRSADREAYLAIKKFTGAALVGEVGVHLQDFHVAHLGRVAKAVVERTRTRLWRTPVVGL